MSVNTEMRPFEKQRDFGTILMVAKLNKEEREIVAAAFEQRNNPFVRNVLRQVVDKLIAHHLLIVDELDLLDLRGCGTDVTGPMRELRGRQDMKKAEILALLKRIEEIL